MVRLYMDLDDANELLYLFYKYIADPCDPQAKRKLQQLLVTLENLATDREKYAKLQRKVWKQFREDRIAFCTKVY